MKKWILVASLLISPFASAYSADAVKAAEDLYKLTVDRFGVGEVTQTDVAQAKAFVFEMKWEAGLISKVDYCADLVPSRAKALQGIKEEERVGQRTIEDVIRAELEYHKVVAFCK